MADTLTFVLELLDRVSGPARKATASLDGLDRAMRPLRNAQGQFMPGAAKGIKELNSGSGEFLKNVAGGLKSVALVAGAVAVGGAVLGAKFAAESLAFKENTLVGFEVMLGTKEAAADIYNKAVDFAAVTPFATKDVVGNIQKLLIAGFKQGEVFDVLNVVGDVGVLKGQEGIESVVRALGQIKAKGKLSGEEMMQLAEAGVSQKLVYDSLGKTLGKTRNELDKLQQAGKITADQGVGAILEAITVGMSGGNAGSLQAKMAKTMTGLTSTLASRPFELVTAANFKGGGGMKFLEDLGNALNPKSDTGGRVVRIIETIGDAITRAFGNPDATKGLSRVLDVLEPLSKMGAAFIDGLAAGGKGALATFERFSDILAMLGISGTDHLDRLTRGFESVGTVVGLVFGAIVVGGAVVAAAAGWVVDRWQKFLDFWRSLPLELGMSWDRFVKVGTDIVEGIWQGLSSAWAGLLSRLGSLVDQLPPAVRSALGIKTGPGAAEFATGGAESSLLSQVQAGSDAFSLENLATRLDAADTAPRAVSASAPHDLGRPSGARSTNNVTVTVNADGRREGESAESYGRRLGRSLGEEFASALEGSALEAGHA
ncbi:MAG: tape measure protein [Myxococcales bacterium]|nr:tape measure protein [Myxococcales bacterium]